MRRSPVGGRAPTGAAGRGYAVWGRSVTAVRAPTRRTQQVRRIGPVPSLGTKPVPPRGATLSQSQQRPDATESLTATLGQRIMILDGAMGTAIQRDRPDEAGYRGERFADWPSDVQGNNDLLTLTAPEIIAGIHREYLEAGADIIETNTLTPTPSRCRTTACRSSPTSST